MHGLFNCYTVMFISSFSHVRLSLDNKRLLTYLLTYLLKKLVPRPRHQNNENHIIYMIGK